MPARIKKDNRPNSFKFITVLPGTNKLKETTDLLSFVLCPF